MAGYIRQRDTEIADGNLIEAEFFKAEYDQLQAAFNSATGHSHNGSAGEGPPITTMGPTQDVNVSAGVVSPRVTNVVDVGTASLRFKNIYAQGLTSTAGAVVAASFTGIGTGLTALDGTQITTGTIPDARLPTTVGRTSRNLVAGAGLTGGGDLSADRTFNIGAGDGISVGADAVNVDATVVRTTGTQTLAGKTLTAPVINGGTITGITDLAVADGGTGASDAAGARASLGAAASSLVITAGSGITGGGDLTAGRTIAVDATVLRTTGDQTVTGVKTFSTAPQAQAYELRSDSNSNLWFRTAAGVNKGVFFHDAANTRVTLRKYSADNTTSAAELALGEDGYIRITGSGLIGPAYGLTTLNADALTGGTVNDARLSSNVPLLNANNTFYGSNTIAGYINSYSENPGANKFGRSASHHTTQYGNATGNFLESVSTTANTKPFYIRVSADSSFSDYIFGVAGSLTVSNGNVVAQKFDAQTSNGFLGLSGDTPAAPSFTWTGDGNTGMYLAASDQIGFATGGAERARITSSGFSGGGASLVNLNGSAISSGTVSEARISSLLARTIDVPTAGDGITLSIVSGQRPKLNITESTVRTLVADGTHGAIGTYAFAGTEASVGSNRNPGDTISGSNLSYANAGGGYFGTPGGTWRCMGFAQTGANVNRSTLWLRIA